MKHKIEVEHVYEAYELYQSVYGRKIQYKQNEARGLLFALAHVPSFKKLDVLELCAGRSEHEAHVRSFAETRMKNEGFKVVSYSTIDRVPVEDAPDTHYVGDVLDISGLNIPKPNVVAAFFYSISSITDEEGSHNILDKLMRSVYNVLGEGGVFYVDYVLNGSHSALGDVKQATSEESFPVEFDSELRSLYKIRPTEDCRVDVTMKSTYDRRTGVNTDEFLTAFNIRVNALTVGKVKVARPMTQRYFNEIEIMEAADRAGFSRVMFFQNDFDEGTFKELDAVASLREDEDESALLSTNMLFMK